MLDRRIKAEHLHRPGGILQALAGQSQAPPTASRHRGVESRVLARQGPAPSSSNPPLTNWLFARISISRRSGSAAPLGREAAKKRIGTNRTAM